MGVNAEGKISLSVELQNFKNIASDLKKGLSAQLKQVPLDVEFNNKDLEKKAAEAIRNINEILSKSRVKNLDLSSILPNFVNEINKEGISDEIRMQMVKGFESALTNLKDIGIKQDYSKLKGFSGEDLKGYIADLNDVMDILKTIEGLTERQKQGILTTVLPSLSNLSGRGKDAAKKEYTKGAKKLDAILQLSGDYNDVLQYGVNPTATLSALNTLNKKTKSGNKLSKNEGQDLLGYLLRGKYLGLEFGKAGDKNLEDLDYDDLLQSAKENLDKATIDYIEKKSTAYFAALDKIYNSSAQEITYSDLTKGIKNTTNQKMQNMFDTEAPENPPTRIRAGSITKRAIKLSSKKKPELRKRTQDEDKKDTKKTKLYSEEEFKDFEFDNEEKSIEEIEKKLQEIENKLSQVRDKIAKSKDDQAQLKEEITNQEKIFEEKNNAYTTYKDNYQAYANYAKNAKYEADALKSTISNLDEQLEQEKQKKEQIETRYNQLIKKREELKKEIEEKEKQLETILPSVQEQESNLEKQLTDLNNKKAEKLKNAKDVEAHNKKALPIQDEWLKWYDEALQKEYKFEGSKAKSDAFEALKRLGNEYLQFRRNPDSSLATNKEAESARFAVKHYKLWQAAKEAGVAESRLDRERFDTDDDFAYQQAIEYLQKQRENTEKRREGIKAELEKAKAEVAKTEEEISQIKAQQKELQEKKKKLLYELRVKPAENEAANESEIKREQVKLDSSNAQIQKIKAQKTKAENNLKGKEQFLQKYELTEEREQNGENRIQKLRDEKDAQEKILNQKKDNLQTEITKQDELIQLEQQLQEKQKLLIQEQKEAQARQEELAKFEEESRKKAEEEKRKQEEANKNQADNKFDSETETASKESKGIGASENIGATIPIEQLQRILNLLENIQKALGTLEDGSDIPSITQSVKNMADALKELSVALGEIKQKDFNLNIGLPNNNPIGQQGEAKRKILKELEQQYNELNSYFVNKYGDDSSAFNALSKLEGGSNYVSTMMSDYSVIGDTNASLSDKIEVYKTLIEQLRNFLIQEGGDLNKVLTNVLSPEEIINKITDDVAKLNPTTAISKIFEDIKVSIDASMAQINTESKGFNFLSGSAEEAAEAKRKFVEANKDVLQSIVASMPKIEQEAKALGKVEDIDLTKNSAPKRENNIEKDIKVEEEKNIELLRIQEARNAIYEQNNSMELEQQKRIEDIKKKELQTALQQNRQQEQVNDFNINKIYTKNDKQNRHELVQNQGKQIQLDVQKEKIEQAKKNYQSELEQARLIEQSEQIRNKSIQDSIKTQKAYSDISEQRLQLQENIQKKRTEQNQKQIQLELEQGRFIEQSLSVQQKKNQDKIKEYEDQLQLYSWDEKGEVDGQLSFLSVIDQNTHDLGEEYKQIIQEEKAHAQKIADEEAKNKPINIPIEGQISFTTNNDINQIGQMINRYTEIGREQIEKQFANLKNKKDYINSELNIEKILNPFGNLSLTKNANELIDIDDQIRNIKTELDSSFDSNGKLIADPQRVFELIKLFDNLMIRVKELKAEINSPTSQENVALRLAQDAEKAKKELDSLKQKIDKNLDSSGLFEAQTQKTINTYGAFGGNGEGKRGALIESGDLKDERFIKQQEQVQELVSKLREYKTAIQELQTLRTSDDATTEQLTKANDKVKELKDNITTLSQTIKTSGIANASEEQIGKLKSGIESFLQRTPNLTGDVREQLEEYIKILNSGASVSKTSYNSMTADLNKFKSAQTSNASIWDLMLMKMKEGIAFLATKFSFYQIFNQFRQGFEVIHQFDDALTEMMKVSDETRTSLERYQKTTFETADAIGTSALQIQNSTADFMRLGETLDQAAESAKSANVLMNVSEFQSIDEATKSLIAMGAAYNDLSKMNIIDKLNEVGNNYAISTSEAATALQSSASALKTAGNDMDEALALITAGNAVVQDANKVGIKDAQR